MLFAQFYNQTSSGELSEACGDRSVIIYDGRVRRETTMDDARMECSRRGFKAYALFHGANFLRCTRITSIQKV